MNRSVMILAASVIFTLASANAFADPSPAATTFTLGQTNKIHDNDGELAFSPTGQLIPPGTTLVAGDILVASVEFTEPGIKSQDPIPGKSYNGVQFNQFNGIEAIQIKAVTPNGTFSNGVARFTYSFEAPSQATYTLLTGISAPAGTTTSLFNNTANNYTRSSGNITTDLATATSGSLMWNLGFTGTTNGDGTVNPNFAKGENQVSQAPATTGGLAAIPPQEATFNSGLNLLTIGPSGTTLGLVGNDFSPDAIGQNPAPGQFDSNGNLVTEAQGTGLLTNLQFSGSLAPGADDFPVASGTNFFILPLALVPEPTGFVLFGLGGGLIGIRALRRQISKKIALRRKLGHYPASPPARPPA
jgi:hypothetical protein